MTCPGKCETCKNAKVTAAAIKFLGLPLRMNDRGWVRFLWMWWYGLPMPLRVAFWLKMVWKFERSAPIDQQPLPGCGCIVAIKDACIRWRNAHGTMALRPAA